MRRLEAIARALGLSDLHNDNVITERCIMYPIDMEVIMNPTDNNIYGTTMDDPLQGAFTFDKDSSNQIMLRQCEDLQESAAELKSILIKTQYELTEIERVMITKCRDVLRQSLHRIVLITTGELTQLIRQPIQLAHQEFVAAIKESLALWKLQIVMEEEKIYQLLQQDILNNDVPIFYYLPEEAIIYYEGEPLARKIDHE